MHAPEIAPPPELAWRGAHKRFADTIALAGVTVELRRGEVLGLLGPNGAGKSTLISLGCGLELPTEGAVVRNAATSIGVMPQEYAVYPALTASQNLRFIGRAWGLRGDRLREAVAARLDAVGLAPQHDTTAGAMSGGMKRRLSFAAATIANPTVLLLDEPTAGVDPQSRLALLELVKAAARSGVAVLYSTHYMEEIQELADRVVVLHEGRVLVEGTVSELVKAHAEPVVTAEVGTSGAYHLTSALASDVLRTQLVEDLGETQRLRISAGRSTLTGAALVATVGRRAAETGVALYDIELQDASLNAAFINLTGRELRD
jgi:ABC-2 type transport system ATP-binding protein